ncbi:MAG: AraC family transcriptional regulator [Lachnospiraceae bacterium]|nr:AraC family transcriptional regulator [Lachnospiraceae bacterium]
MPYPLPANRNFSVTYRETPAGTGMPTMCCAEDFYEIGYIVKGDRKSMTPDHVYFMHSGCIILTRPGLLHQSTALKETPFHRYLVKVSNPVMEQIAQRFGKEKFEVLCEEHVLYIKKEEQETIAQIFADMLIEYERYDVYTEQLLADLLFRLLVHLQRYKLSAYHPQKISASTNESILKAIRYIDENLLDTPSITDTAQMVGLNKDYFSRLFKKEMGTTYSEYIVVIRLLLARNLLMNTNMNLHEIAMECGFSNGNYLSNQFKKHFHMTTTEYKQRYGGGDYYPDCTYV